MRRKKPDSVLKYLDDSALENYAKQDRLRHSGIVEGLTQILKDAPEGACIGFFGLWGSGKTSILKALEKQWKGDFVYFDAWRHDVDSFRCELIQACYKCGRDQVPAEIRKRLKTSQTTSVNKWRWASLQEIVMGVVAGLLAATAALLFWWDPSRNWSEAFSGGSVGGAIAFIVAFVLSRIRVKEQYEIQLTELPVAAPAEFRQLFETFLSDRSKHGHVVLAIDNLDRCDSETVVEMLACLNAFLNHKDSKCVVACDEDALVRHLKSQRKGQPDVQGYLDKIFGIKMWLPAPSHSDLDKLVRELLGEIEVELPAHQRDALVYELAANPRDIKGLLNDVQAVRAMLTSQVDSGAIPDFDLNEAVPKVVKLMLIRRRASKLFSHYIRSPMDFEKHQENPPEGECHGEAAETTEEVARLLREPPVLSFTDAVTLLSWKSIHEFLADPASTALGQVLYAGAAPSSLQEEYPTLPADAKQPWVECLANGIRERIGAEADHHHTVEIVATVAQMWDKFELMEQTELADVVVYALSIPVLLSQRLQEICGNPKIGEIVRSAERDSRNKVFGSVLRAAEDAPAKEKMAALEFLDDLRDILPPGIGGRYFSLLLESWEESQASEFARLIDQAPYTQWDVPPDAITSFIDARLEEAKDMQVKVETWEPTVSALLSLWAKADETQYGELWEAIQDRLSFEPNQRPNQDQEEAMTAIVPKLAHVVGARGFEGDISSAVQWATAWFGHYLLQGPKQLPNIAALLEAAGGEKALEDAGEMATEILQQPGAVEAKGVEDIAGVLDELTGQYKPLASAIADGLSSHFGRVTLTDESMSTILAHLADEQVLPLFNQLLVDGESDASQQAITVYKLLAKSRKTPAFLEEVYQQLQEIVDQTGLSQADYEACAGFAIDVAIEASSDVAFESMKKVLRLACKTQGGMLGTAEAMLAALEGRLPEYVEQNPAFSRSFSVTVTVMLEAIKPSKMEQSQAELVVEALQVLAQA